MSLTDSDIMDDREMSPDDKLTKLLLYQKNNHARLEDMTKTVNGIDIALRGDMKTKQKGLIQEVGELGVRVDNLEEENTSSSQPIPRHPEAAAPVTVAKKPDWADRGIAAVIVGAVVGGGTNADRIFAALSAFFNGG